MIATLVLMTGSLLTSCATTPPTTGPTASSGSTQPGTPAVRQGYTVGIISHDDPARPVHVTWPQFDRATALNKLMASWSSTRSRDFLADYDPAPSNPPELDVSWDIPLSSQGMLGVRLDAYTFAGASGATTSASFYGDEGGAGAWASADLIESKQRRAAVDAIVAAVRASGKEPFEESPTPDAALLNDVSFDANGNMLVRIEDGLLLAYSEGEVMATVPRDKADPLLSAEGRRIRDAYIAQGGPSTLNQMPTVAPSPAEPSTDPQTTQPAQSTQPATSTPAAPQAPASSAPQVPAPPKGTVDCAKLKCVALTFDDGPGPYTAKLLDELKAADVKATFFVLGTSVRAHPDVVRRAAAEGHIVGNHTMTHKQLSKLGLAAQRDEATRGAAQIAAAGAPAPSLMRPPYGSLNADTKKLGYPLILWNVDSEDWKNRNVAATTALIKKQTRSGSIILMHDIHRSTVEAVPGIITWLKSEGYTLVTVPELIGNLKPGQKYLGR